MIFPANSYYHDISCQLLSSWYFLPTLNNIIFPAKSIIIIIVLANFNLMIFPANSYYHNVSCQLLSSWYFLPTLIIIIFPVNPYHYPILLTFPKSCMPMTAKMNMMIQRTKVKFERAPTVFIMIVRISFKDFQDLASLNTLYIHSVFIHL